MTRPPSTLIRQPIDPLGKPPPSRHAFYVAGLCQRRDAFGHMLRCPLAALRQHLLDAAPKLAVRDHGASATASSAISRPLLVDRGPFRNGKVWALAAVAEDSKAAARPHTVGRRAHINQEG